MKIDLQLIVCMCLPNVTIIYYFEHNEFSNDKWSAYNARQCDIRITFQDLIFTTVFYSY